VAEAMRATRRVTGTFACVLALAWTLPGQVIAAPTTAPAPTPSDPKPTSSKAPASAPASPDGSDDAQDADEVGPSSDTSDGDGNVPVIARAGLEVDTTKAGPAGPVMLSRIEELGNLELRRAEILPRRAGDDPVIRVRVELRGDEGDTYAIFSEVDVRGKPLEGSPREVVCSLCTEGEAVERARSELLRLVPFVRARFRAARAKPTDVTPVDTQPQPPPRDTGLGKFGKAGVGLLAGGALVLGTGIGLAVAEPRPDKNDPLREVNTRPAGYGVLAVGAAAIITGAVLLIVDRRKARNVAQLAPMIQTGTAGLVLVGRF
jgi:hypothetical protein